METAKGVLGAAGAAYYVAGDHGKNMDQLKAEFKTLDLPAFDLSQVRDYTVLDYQIGTIVPGTKGPLTKVQWMRIVSAVSLVLSASGLIYKGFIAVHPAGWVVVSLTAIALLSLYASYSSFSRYDLDNDKEKQRAAQLITSNLVSGSFLETIGKIERNREEIVGRGLLNDAYAAYSNLSRNQSQSLSKADFYSIVLSFYGAWISIQNETSSKLRQLNTKEFFEFMHESDKADLAHNGVDYATRKGAGEGPGNRVEDTSGGGTFKNAANAAGHLAVDVRHHRQNRQISRAASNERERIKHAGDTANRIVEKQMQTALGAQPFVAPMSSAP